MCKFLWAFAKSLRERLLAVSCSSIRLFAWNSATSDGLNIMKCHIWDAYEIWRHVSIMVKIKKMTDTSHEGIPTFVMSRSDLPS